MKNTLIPVALGLLVVGSACRLSIDLGSTATTREALSPTRVSPNRFWEDKLNPSLVEFQNMNDSAAQTNIEDLAPLIASMDNSSTELRVAEASNDMPQCAAVGLSKVIEGEESVVLSWRIISSSNCIYDAACVTQADQTAKAGQAMLESGIAQIKDDCGIE